MLRLTSSNSEVNSWLECDVEVANVAIVLMFQIDKSVVKRICSNGRKTLPCGTPDCML